MSSVYLLPYCECRGNCYPSVPGWVNYCSGNKIRYRLYDPHTEDYNHLVYWIKKNGITEVGYLEGVDEDKEKIKTLLVALCNIKCNFSQLKRSN